MRTRLLCVMVAAACLAACETLYQDNRATPQNQTTAEAAPARVQEPAPSPTPRPAQKRPPRPKPSTPPPAATPPEPPPITVVGLSRAELTRTLGDPLERTDRNPGQAWVYRAGGCSLEVLFLFDVVRNDMYVVDRKLTGTDGTARGEQQCLQRIKATHAS